MQISICNSAGTNKLRAFRHRVGQMNLLNNFTFSNFPNTLLPGVLNAAFSQNPRLQAFDMSCLVLYITRAFSRPTIETESAIVEYLRPVQSFASCISCQRVRGPLQKLPVSQLFSEPKRILACSKRPVTGQYPIQLNPLHVIQPRFFKIHFTTVLA